MKNISPQGILVQFDRTPLVPGLMVPGLIVLIVCAGEE